VPKAIAYLQKVGRFEEMPILGFDRRIYEDFSFIGKPQFFTGEKQTEFHYS